MTHRPYWSCALALGLAVSSSGRGQTAVRVPPLGTTRLTFSVPVTVRGFSPDISQFQVLCQTAADSGGGNAKGYLNIPLSDGAYSGTVDIPLALTVLHPGTKWNYRCILSFFNSKTNQWGLGTDSWNTAAPGTPFQPSVTGSVIVGPAPRS